MNPSAMILPMAIPDWARGREIEQDEYGLWCVFCPDIETHAWLNCPVAKIVTDSWRPHYQFERVPLREEFAYRVDVNCKTEREKAVHYLLYKGDGGDPHDDNNWHTWSDWQPAERMPDWAVRRWILVRTVEARRVESITEEEAEQCGYRAESCGCTADCNSVSAKEQLQEDWLAWHGAGQWVWFISGEITNAIES